MDLAFIFAAAERIAEEQEKSELPFFIMGGLLVTFAIAVSVLGFKRAEFPATASAARGVMSAGVVLVVAAVGTAIYVAL